MEKQLPNSKKWFTRRRLVVLTCFALLVSFVGGIWILRPGSLQREVEAVGGRYTDQSLDFQSQFIITNWKSVLHALLQTVQGKSLHYISINFRNTDVSDIWVRQYTEILKSQPVNSIDFHGTKITDATVTDLAGMNALFSLDLSDTLITDHSMSSIRQMPSLKLIYLGDTNVTADGISQLVGLPWLGQLELSGDVLTDETMVHLNAMPRLQSLGLKDFNNDELSRLVGMKNLKALSLTEATDQALPSILQLSQIRFLILEDSQLSTKSVEEIRNRLPKLVIHQRISDERSLELGIPQRLAAEERLKRTIFIAVALGGGCLILLIVIVLRRRWSRRQQHS